MKFEKYIHQTLDHVPFTASKGDKKLESQKITDFFYEKPRTEFLKSILLKTISKIDYISKTKKDPFYMDIHILGRQQKVINNIVFNNTIILRRS